MAQRETMSLKDGQAQKPVAKLLVANGRYVTRGAPRSGGLASVYQATDTDSGDTVALKVFKTGEGTDPVVEESFRREVQALTDLKHPNIVRIVDSGRDSEADVHYIVMEWVDADLRQLCERESLKTWDEFYRTAGGGVLEALVYAHSRSTVHRDVKPSNVLVSGDGVVKLCDFGISKIRRFLSPGVTLRQFASMPFAPPEPDDGSYSYSRDVFGFAALAVVSLAKAPIGTHRELLAALEEVAIPESLRTLLRRCLNLDDPTARPTNAVTLRAELERALPPAAARHDQGVLFTLTNKVRRVLEADMGLRADAADRFAERDLEGAVAEELAPTPDHPERALRLYGGKYGYNAVVEESGCKLVLVSAMEPSASELDRRRAAACEVGLRLQLAGTGLAASKEALAGLTERLLFFSGEQKLRKLEEKEQAIYRKWLNLLSAKTELEKLRRFSMEYVKRDAQGEFLKLTPKPGVSVGGLMEQDVAIEVRGGRTFRGKVVSASAGAISIRPSEWNEVEMSAVSSEGTLEKDTRRTDVALDKQKAAVDAVRYGRSVDTELGKHIVNPDQVLVPPLVQVEFIQTNIDEDKKEAVVAAFSGPELMIVEGPPGTGKTTFITELVLQTLRANPTARVLLTSQTHVALDNSLERIVKVSGEPVEAVRIGHESNDRIADSTRRLMLDAKLPELRKRALAPGRAFVERWASERGVNPKDMRRAMALERHAGLKARLEGVEADLHALQPQLTDDYRKTLDPEARSELDDRFEGLTSEREELARALKESWSELAVYVEEKEDLKEYEASSAADLKVWAEAFAGDSPHRVQLRALLQAHGDWEARFGRSSQFQAAVIAGSQVVAGTCLGVMGIPGRSEIVYDLCIIDEASIATPTEALVPMSRSRRTVLVGDSKQLPPFQDAELRKAGLLLKFDLQPQDQKATLFNHLRDGLPSGLKKALWTQHRMIPAIGDLVSECFYGGDLKTVERAQETSLVGATPRPVTWYSTSRRSDRASRTVDGGTSHYNLCEVDEVTRLLGRIDFRVQKGKGDKKKFSVAVLTGYSAQMERLNTAIATSRHKWATYTDIFVNVVDAFQGREADILIFSLTRSGADTLGFLRDMERINVALSRGKELLAIVGDHAFCQSVPDAVNPLREVLDYIRGNPGTCELVEVEVTR
ncbi:hypothetical protein GCM10028796_41600 [Ramlibacter monticola]|uniref:Protein kinase n=1 Tax=Ramlibacter monticola TaxID=1926872 RepID=A0A937CVB5_9BURK|nr:serine/threonine-protein kinase [Ramlibacter monticola]MBL0393573.1 protein kinase [Ramlibacter monticola]